MKNTDEEIRLTDDLCKQHFGWSYRYTMRQYSKGLLGAAYRKVASRKAPLFIKKSDLERLK